MKDKKLTKWDYLNFLFLGLIFLLFLVILLAGDKILGSMTDWSSQHAIFPGYFKTLFLETKDLFPDFALNIGAGQNIYNFAYYGLLNPVIMLSYIMPNVNSVTYLMVSTSILVFISVIIMYIFLKKHGFSRGITFIATFLFMCATPMLFHLHRHIMFINYMPFLLLGLMGIDKYFDEKKSWLLTLSTFLMILMSYYYSVVGIIVFVIYGVYRYIEMNEKITIKNFFVDGIKFVFPIFIGIFLAGILIIPTFYVILNGRGATTVTITLKELLLPNIHLDYALYDYYGIGLSVIAIFALINFLFKKREKRYLGIVLALVLVFPVINYIFNATMYIDAKSLIPLLPLYILVIAEFLKDIFNKNINIKLIVGITLIIIFIGYFCMNFLKYLLIFDTIVFLLALLLYYKTNYKSLFGIVICIVAFCISFGCSKYDRLVDKEFLYGSEYNKQQEVIKKVTDQDKEIYRITNQITPGDNSNRVYNNIHYLQTTLYSSTYNKEYNKFYYDVMNNAIQSRNRVITSSAKNYPFLLLTANKYLVTDADPIIGYNEYLNLDGIKVYKNEQVLPMAYATNSLMSLKKFESLGYPYNQDAILKNIIVDKDVNDDFTSNVQKTDLEFTSDDINNLNITKDGNTTIIDVKERTRVTLNLKNPLENTLLYIHFKILESNSCKVGDSIITINGINNKLTCDPWKYHNNNYEFDYVLAKDTIDALTITLTKGVYKIEDIEFYTLDYNTISNIKDNVDEFIFDKEKTKGDIIEGDIDVTNDSYFVLSVPYDKGFNVYVDGQKKTIEKVNVSFLGFQINEGKHHVKIEYKAPGKDIGVCMSFMGLLLFVGNTIFEERKLNKERKKSI